MNEHLRLDRAGQDFIKSFERCARRVDGNSYKAYRDSAGVLTIGWGHTNALGRQFNASAVWTRAECDAVFAEDVATFEDAVRRRVKVSINQDQFNTLVSFAFNCGEKNLQRSTLLKKVNRRDFEGAAREFARWNRAAGKVLPGLVRRRASEALMFQGVADADRDGEADMPRAGDPPEPPKTMAQSKVAASEVVKGTLAAGGATAAAIEAASDDKAAAVETAGRAIDTAGRAVDVARDIAPTAMSFGKIAWGLITDPVVILIVCLVVIGLSAFTWFDRRAKLYQEGV